MRSDASSFRSFADAEVRLADEAYCWTCEFVWAGDHYVLITRGTDNNVTVASVSMLVSTKIVAIGVASWSGGAVGETRACVSFDSATRLYSSLGVLVNSCNGAKTDILKD